jgi:hypothetical protein
MPKSKARRLDNLPLRNELGDLMGNGQDNMVYPIVTPAPKPHLRQKTDWVAKINHEETDKSFKTRAEDPKTAAELGIRYKKNKYKVLKHFLGDFIPDTHFVLTEGHNGDTNRFVEMTLQKEVPKVTLNELSPDQKANPALGENLLNLLGRLQYMYKVIGEANGRSSQEGQLDAKLDLGGVSDAVRAQALNHAFENTEVDEILDSNKSPNLLVDPETGNLYCIDFDQGQWNDSMGDTMQLAFEIDAQNRERAARHAGALAMTPPN